MISIRLKLIWAALFADEQGIRSAASKALRYKPVVHLEE